MIEKVNNISREAFHENFVKKGIPVIIQGMMSQWEALNWNSTYLKNYSEKTFVDIKVGNVSEGRRESMNLLEYLELLELESEFNRGETKVGYLHDVPLFSLIPDLLLDVKPFPVNLFPKWYRLNWHRYVQFFIGPKGSFTPLHFDTLGTHNLFFQIKGSKRFILIPKNQRRNCYMSSWRWANFDPSNPDYIAFPKAKEINQISVVVEQGDILYIPPYTLHHVNSLKQSISFNIDWHTPSSARKGIFTVFRGAPMKNVYYNFLLYLGLEFGISEEFVFPRFKSYLSYVS